MPITTEHRNLLTQSAGVASVCVALTLIILKTWAWQTTDSIALLSSLADSALDLASSLITFFAIRFALTPADHDHRFGHGKSEAIAAFLQAIIISGSAAYVAYRAVLRLLNPEVIDSPSSGYVVMTISLVLTISLVSYQRYVARQTKSVAVLADAAHYRADILSNLATIIAIVATAQFGWVYADPAVGLLVVALIMKSVWEILRPALDELLDREFPDHDREKIESIALAHNEVRGVHDIRTRSAGMHQFIQFHLEFDSEMTLANAHEISEEISVSVRKQFPQAEVLIHADPEDDSANPL